MRIKNSLEERQPNNSRMLSIVYVTIVTVLAAWSISDTYAANGSVAYTYDALGRVKTVSYDTGVCIIYTYDPNGNRLSEVIRVSASGGVGVWGCFNWNSSGGAVWGP
jgi:uncharacterized protein RhaS with RHS repeats